MTSVKWLIDKLAISEITHKKLFEQAIEMHKAEHGKTWDKAIEAHENRGHNIERSWCDFDVYYKETFNKSTMWNPSDGAESAEELNEN